MVWWSNIEHINLRLSHYQRKGLKSNDSCGAFPRRSVDFLNFQSLVQRTHFLTGIAGLRIYRSKPTILVFEETAFGPIHSDYRRLLIQILKRN